MAQGYESVRSSIISITKWYRCQNSKNYVTIEWPTSLVHDTGPRPGLILETEADMMRYGTPL